MRFLNKCSRIKLHIMEVGICVDHAVVALVNEGINLQANRAYKWILTILRMILVA